ncbi:MAG: SLBB domain-containing protein [Pyrinomonadaceae bacterium]
MFKGIERYGLGKTGFALTVLLAFIFVQYSYSQQRSATSQTNANLIHFGDLIDVDVVGSFEFDWRGTLTPEGFLDGLDKSPNKVYGLCRNESDVAEEIAREYSGFLRNPRVIVKILDRSNRAVAFLDGAVKLPQRFQIRRRIFLNELIILSGGITDNSSGEVRIFRPQSLSCGRKSTVSSDLPDEKASNFAIRISDLLAGTDGANPQIISGDIVTIVEAAPVFLTGGLNVPKQISLRVETSLSRAVAMAGGVSQDGLENRIRIFRRDGKAGKVIEADLKKILAKKAADPILQAYDVVEVEQKGRGSRKPAAVTQPIVPAGNRLSKLPLRIVD